VGESDDGTLALGDQDQSDPEYLRYIEDLNYIFGGLWEYKNNVYQPYAKVTSFDRLDMAWAANADPCWAERPSREVPFSVILGRVRYYADSQDTDIATTYIGKTSPWTTILDRDSDLETKMASVLWRPISDVPLSIKPHKVADDALEEALALGRTLDVRECWTVRDPNELRVDEDAGVSRTAGEWAPPPDEEAQREKAYQDSIGALRTEILEAVKAAGDEWITCPVFANPEDAYNDGVEPSRYIQLPKLPFLAWTYSRTNVWRIAPELLPNWKVICPPGLKMYSDDPVHSDWVLGAGLDLDTFYKDDAVVSATYRLRSKILEETLKFGLVVFSGTGRVFGSIVHLKPGEVLTKKDQIGVIPSSGVEYDAALRSAGKLGTAIIAAVGGKLSHVATVARENEYKFAMWGPAADLRDDALVTLDFDNGMIKLSEL
jgi:hypothetical protein